MKENFSDFNNCGDIEMCVKAFGVFILITHLIIQCNCRTFPDYNSNLQIIKRQTFEMDCIQVVHPTDMDNNVTNFIYKLEIPLQVSNGLEVNSICPNLIVTINSMETLAFVMENRATRKGVIFIVFTQTTNWPDAAIVAEHYWLTHGIYNVFYINQDNFKFYHPFLFRNGNYGSMVDATQYNINDIFRNLHRYPMRVYIFDSVFSNVTANPGTLTVKRVDGVDSKVAYLLEKVMNFTMELQWPDDDFFGARLDNGSFNGAIGRMIRGETDITLAGFFVKDYLTRDIEFSVPVYMDKLCCYVMKAKRIPKSILPLYAVNGNVWGVYMTVGVLSSFVWMFLRRLNLWINSYGGDRIEIKPSRLQYLHIFSDTWVLWVRMIIVRFPPFNAERVFAISLCLVSVIIGALLESSLATVYIRPHYYKDINTLKALDETKMRIFFKHAAMQDDLFKGQYSEVYANLDKRLMLVGEPEERLISIMAKRGGFVAITRAFSLQLVDTYYITTKKIHMIPECPKTYHIAYLYGKQSTYAEPVNAALLKFLAAGLIDHWIDEKQHEAKCRIHNFKDYVPETSNQWKILQISDLQLAFYVLATGNILSAILFLAEYIIHYKLKSKINHLK